MKQVQNKNRHYSSICLLAKNENDYINEWLDWHLNKLKFNHIYIYDNESKIPIETSIEDKYKDRVTINRWTKRDYRGIMQVCCYSHFLNNYGRDNKWTAFIDADEFIRLIDDIDINSFLSQYEDCDGIYIEWLMYNANGQYKKEEGLVRDRFTTYTEYKNKPWNGKSIVKPHTVKIMGAHTPRAYHRRLKLVYSNKEFINEEKNDAPLDKIVIDHYFTKSYEEWCEKLARGSCNTLIRKIEEFFLFNPDMNPKEVK